MSLFSSPDNFSVASLSDKTLKMIQRSIADSFRVPLNQLPRVLFHGLILALIVCGFWLLDSLKDPVLTKTVGIEYQPIAKLLSVFTTLIVVCIYDFLTSIVSKSSLFLIISVVFGLITMVISAFLSDPEIGLDYKHKGPHRIIGWCSYCAIESYGSLMVALFWSFTNSIMDLEQAKGAYGLIIAIAQIGALVGSTLATNATIFGVAQLYLLGSIMILLVSLLVKTYHLTYRDHITESIKTKVRSISAEYYETQQQFLFQEKNRVESTETVFESLNFSQFFVVLKTKTWKIIKYIMRFFEGFYEGLSLILKYNYTLKLLIVSCLYEVVVTILDYQFKLMGSISIDNNDIIQNHNKNIDINNYNNNNYNQINNNYNNNNNNNNINNNNQYNNLNDHVNVIIESTTKNIIYNINSNENRFANLLGHFGQFTNLISFFVSCFGFSYMVHYFGINKSLMIFPITLFISIIITYLIPTLWVSFVFVSILKAMLFSLHDPLKELLYIPTSDAIKFKAKAWIDVFGSRFSKAVGSFLCFIAYGNAHRLRNLSEIPCIILSIVIILFTFLIGLDFKKLIEENAIVGNDDFKTKNYFINFDSPPIVNNSNNNDNNNKNNKDTKFDENKNIHSSTTNTDDKNNKQEFFYNLDLFKDVFDEEFEFDIKEINNTIKNKNNIENLKKNSPARTRSKSSFN
jgi:AAA family ATP:ADP antiporter